MVNFVAGANFYTDTVFNWGFQNTAIWDNNLALLLNNDTGTIFLLVQFKLVPFIESTVKIL